MDSTSTEELKSALITVSTLASKVPSSAQEKSPMVTVAVWALVRPPGFSTSRVTYRTSRPPVSVSSILLTEVTVPSNCSPVSVSVTTPWFPAPMAAASPDRKGTRIFITLSL